MKKDNQGQIDLDRVIPVYQMNGGVIAKDGKPFISLMATDIKKDGEKMPDWIFSHMIQAYAAGINSIRGAVEQMGKDHGVDAIAALDVMLAMYEENKVSSQMRVSESFKANMTETAQTLTTMYKDHERTHKDLNRG